VKILPSNFKFRNPFISNTLIYMSSPRRQTILFVYSHFSSFVKADFDMLSSMHFVDKYEFSARPGIFNVGFHLIKQFLFLLFHIRKYDSIYIWFADYHSLLPVLFAKIYNRHSFIVIGGYDAARIKKLNYGVFCSQIRGFFAIKSIKNSTANLPVSRYVERKVKYIAPHSTCYIVYNSMNLGNETHTDIKKENLVLTVAIIDNQRTFKLKGIDTFINVVRILPQYNFVAIGISKVVVNELVKDCPRNLIIYERVPHEELLSFYKKANIYCQLSLTESFGVAIAEAMYYHCLPVVINNGAMPEIVGNFGKIVRKDTSEIATAIVQLSTNSHYNENLQMEDYIRIHFSPENRKTQLISILEQI